MKHSVLTKVFLLLFIVEIPLFLAGYTVIRYASGQLTEEMIGSFKAEAGRFSSELDTAIRNTYLSNLPLSEQSNIQKLTFYHDSLPVYQKAQLINTLSEQLGNIISTNSCLESAHIYYRDDGTVYHMPSTVTGNHSPVDGAQWDKVLELALRPEVLQRYENEFLEKEVISLFIAPVWQTNPRFLIELVLSESYIHQLAMGTSRPEDKYVVSICGKAVSTNMTAEELAAMDDFLPGTDKPFYLNHANYYLADCDMPFCGGTYTLLISSEATLRPLQLNLLFLICFMAVLLVSSVFFFVGVYRLVHKPLVKLIQGFDSLEKGNFGYQIQGITDTDFAYLYDAFNKMSVKLNHLIEQDYEQQILIQKAELKQLQAQINPHFLYNSFFLLQTMLKSDLKEEAEKGLELLALYFRYITKNSMDYVPLEEEYRHAENYVALQLLRFKQRISVHMDKLPEACRQILCPKMILQPIIENAFKYGLKNKLKNGIISMGFTYDAVSVRITVEDNGEELSDERLCKLQTDLREASSDSSLHEMSGLLNIHRRLTIYSRSHGEINVSRSGLGGLQVDLVLDMAAHPETG